MFRDVFAGIDPDLDAQVEFGTFQKVGDPTTRKQTVCYVGSLKLVQAKLVCHKLVILCRRKQTNN